MTAPRTEREPLVKICGLRDPAQARACARLGAWGIGVVLARSPRRVAEEEAAAVLSALPPEVARVGVFVDAEPDSTARVAHRIGLTHVQVHGESDPAAIAAASGLPVIHGIRVDGAGALERARRSPAQFVLLDAAVPGLHGGSGARFDWRLLERARSGFTRPFGVAGGLDADNVAEAVRRLRPQLVDVSSGVESGPGMKDLGLVAAFIAAARAPLAA